MSVIITGSVHTMHNEELARMASTQTAAQAGLIAAPLINIAWTILYPTTTGIVATTSAPLAGVAALGYGVYKLYPYATPALKAALHVISRKGQ